MFLAEVVLKNDAVKVEKKITYNIFIAVFGTQPIAAP